jgi:hypothetical protein
MIKRPYRLREVAYAAGLTPGTLSSWFARGHVIMSPQKGDHETSGSGHQRLFSFYRAVHIATMAELARLGIFPALYTSQLAFSFSDLGTPERPPAELFPTGRTWLVIRCIDGKLEGAVENVFTGAEIDLFRDRRRRIATSVIVLDMNQLVARVRSRLPKENI